MASSVEMSRLIRNRVVAKEHDPYDPYPMVMCIPEMCVGIKQKYSAPNLKPILLKPI